MSQDPVPWWQDFIADVAGFLLPKPKFTLFDPLMFMPIPERDIPSLFAVDAPGFISEVHWTVARRDDRTIMLRGRPKSGMLRDRYQEFSVILDLQTSRPLAQKTIDASGNLETVIL
jgi:hypothetical protein